MTQREVLAALHARKDAGGVSDLEKWLVHGWTLHSRRGKEDYVAGHSYIHPGDGEDESLEWFVVPPPQPKYRAYDKHEAIDLVGRQVIYKGEECWIAAVHVDANRYHIDLHRETEIKSLVSAQDLLDRGQWPDGTPCGVRES